MGALKSLLGKLGSFTIPFLSGRFSTGGRKWIEIDSVEQPIAAGAKKAWKRLRKKR